MPPLLSTPAHALQSRLESISMRLDAAADNLLQTRDLLIRHLEHQMLQLQEVRAALHEAAREAERSAAQVTAQHSTHSSSLGQGPVKPNGGLDLEALFAPLNALQRTPAAENSGTASETPGTRSLPVDERLSEVPLVSAEVLFDAEPSPASSWESDLRDVFQGTSSSAEDFEAVPMASATAPTISQMTRVHLDPAPVELASHEIDPALEKATLDELNEALTRAFAQIATRQASH